MSQDSQHGVFPHTSATLVALAADPSAPGWRQAWERFFREYSPPLLAWLRRTGSASQESHDLLQDFFVSGLDGKLLSAWDPRRGRLRTYLLACLTNHRRKAWRRERARPDREPIEEAGPREPSGDDPDAAFERDWNRCVLDRALEAVETRLRESKDETGARLLREWVLAPTRPDANALAAALGVSRGVVYTRGTRLRQALAEEVERRLSWLQTRPAALAQERDEVLRLFREGA